jgi:hypothetical protein
VRKKDTAHQRAGVCSSTPARRCCAGLVSAALHESATMPSPTTSRDAGAPARKKQKTRAQQFEAAEARLAAMWRANED